MTVSWFCRKISENDHKKIKIPPNQTLNLQIAADVPGGKSLPEPYRRNCRKTVYGFMQMHIPVRMNRKNRRTARIRN